MEMTDIYADPLENQIRRLTREALPGSGLEFFWTDDRDALGGLVIWDGFAEMDTSASRSLVEQVIESRFEGSRNPRVGPFFTTTPVRLAAQREPDGRYD